jgi:hypothetical protein
MEQAVESSKTAPAAGHPLFGTWKLESIVYEATANGQRSCPYGDHPDDRTRAEHDQWKGRAVDSSLEKSTTGILNTFMLCSKGVNCLWKYIEHSRVAIVGKAHADNEELWP